MISTWQISGLNPTVSSCVYHDRHCDIQPWAQVAHHYCSAQVNSAFYPCGQLTWASELSTNSKWWWWTWTTAANKWTHRPSWLAMSEALCTWHSVGIHYMSWLNSHMTVVMIIDDSTINSDFIIIIIIIIITIMINWTHPFLQPACRAHYHQRQSHCAAATLHCCVVHRRCKPKHPQQKFTCRKQPTFCKHTALGQSARQPN